MPGGIDLNVSGLAELLRQDQVRFRQATLEKIVAWASSAIPPDPQAEVRHRILLAQDDDRRQKTLEIRALELDLAQHLVHTPYVLLMACTGINVVHAADLAGEMGLIANYAKASCITGRAGIFPGRYQSDETDRTGSLVWNCNRRLRAVLMRIADTLILCNPYYRGLVQLWNAHRADDEDDLNAAYVRTKIASKFSRLAFQLVAGRQTLRHSGVRDRSYILLSWQARRLPHSELGSGRQNSDLRQPWRRGTARSACRIERAAQRDPARRFAVAWIVA